MLDIVSKADLRALAESDDAHCVSVYLPTHRAGRETGQDPIRLKNLLSEAGEELVSLGMSRSRAEELLAPVTRLLADADFLAHLEDGLAAFVDSSGARVYRLPESVEELVVVSDRFHLTPLLPSVTSSKAFYVLALSQNQVRLLRGTRYRVSELELADIPESLAEAMWYLDREKQLQLHGADRAGQGRVAAIFHGHGMGKEIHDTDIAQFFRAVDNGIHTIIPDHSAPLVLAGVGFLQPIYRTASRYPRIVEAGIEGNPESLGADELHERAWPLVEPIFAEDQQAARDAFRQQTARAVSSAPDAVEAAHLGKIASLFVPKAVQCWGVVDEDGRVVEQHDDRVPGDRDLVDDAAIAALVHGGSVFVVDAADVPGPGVVAGVLRF